MACYNMNNNSFQVLYVWKPLHLCHKSSTIDVATLTLGLRGCKVAGQEEACESHHILPGMHLGLATKAKGLQGCEAKRKPVNHITYSRECKKVRESEPSHSQGNSHFGRWSPDGVPKL